MYRNEEMHSKWCCNQSLTNVFVREAVVNKELLMLICRAELRIIRISKRSQWERFKRSAQSYILWRNKWSHERQKFAQRGLGLGNLAASNGWPNPSRASLSEIDRDFTHGRRETTKLSRCQMKNGNAWTKRKAAKALAKGKLSLVACREKDSFKANGVSWVSVPYADMSLGNPSWGMPGSDAEARFWPRLWDSMQLQSQW